MNQGAAARLNAPPFSLGDVVLAVRNLALQDPQSVLGPGVLVGHMPEDVGGEAWTFRTRHAVVANSAKMETAGLSTDMLVWPLKRRGAGALISAAIRVGRAPTNEVAIPHGDISKLHARLVPKGDAMTVVDEGSTNGTSLNGRKLEAHQAEVLTSGDQVVVGGLPALRFLTTSDLMDLLVA